MALTSHGADAVGMACDSVGKGAVFGPVIVGPGGHFGVVGSSSNESNFNTDVNWDSAESCVISVGSTVGTESA